MDSLREKELRLEQLLPLITEQLAEGKTVRFFPRGCSMRPLLRQGRDQVVLAPVTGELKKYDIPFYRRDDGHFVLHRIVEVGETYTCIGDNQHELEHGIRRDQILAVAVAVVREGREIPVTNLGYRVYSRLIHWLRPVKGFLGRCKRAVLRRLKK